MKIPKHIIKVSLLATTIIVGFLGYRKFTKPKDNVPAYKTEKPQKKKIRQVINTTGVLEIKEILKIGSRVPGNITEIYTKENQQVKKGDTLALIEMTKGDTEVKSAQKALEKAKKDFLYQQKYYKRQKSLYQAGQISQNAFENIETNYLKIEDDYKIATINLETKSRELRLTKILSPEDGIITNVLLTKGSTVSDYDNKIFELALNITDMKVTLDIDESEVGMLKEGQKVIITVNSFPDFPIKTKISEISCSPKGDSSGKSPNTSGALFYKATAPINNQELRFRPGMMVTAEIRIAKAKDALCLNNFAFTLDPNVLKEIAKEINYQYLPLDKKQQKSFTAAHPHDPVRLIWIAHDHKFIQKPIVLGITDNTVWQVTLGLTENDNVIIDLKELDTDAMKKLYEKWTRGSL